MEPEFYSEKVKAGGEKKLALLLRSGLYGYQNFGLSMLAGDQYVWFGYPFFDKYYVNFNYGQDKI